MITQISQFKKITTINENIFSNDLIKLLNKHGVSEKWFKKVIDLDELTKDELNDLDYVEDRIMSHLSHLDTHDNFGNKLNKYFSSIDNVYTVFKNNGINIDVHDFDSDTKTGWGTCYDNITKDEVLNIVNNLGYSYKYSISDHIKSVENGYYFFIYFDLNDINEQIDNGLYIANNIAYDSVLTIEQKTQELLDALSNSSTTNGSTTLINELNDLLDTCFQLRYKYDKKRLNK